MWMEKQTADVCSNLQQGHELFCSLQSILLFPSAPASPKGGRGRGGGGCPLGAGWSHGGQFMVGMISPHMWVPISEAQWHSNCAGPPFCPRAGFHVVVFKGSKMAVGHCRWRHSVLVRREPLPTLLFLLQEAAGFVMQPWKCGSEISNVCSADHTGTVLSILANCNCFAVKWPVSYMDCVPILSGMDKYYFFS